MVLSNKLNSEFLKLPYRNLSMIIRQGLPLGGSLLFWEYTFTLLYTIDMWSQGYRRKYFLKKKVKFPFLVPTVVSLSWPCLLLLKAVKTFFLSHLLVISSKVLYGCTMSWQVKIKRNPCNGKHVENANSQHSCQLSLQLFTLLRWKKKKYEELGKWLRSGLPKVGPPQGSILSARWLNKQNKTKIYKWW